MGIESIYRVFFIVVKYKMFYYLNKKERNLTNGTIQKKRKLFIDHKLDIVDKI